MIALVLLGLGIVAAVAMSVTKQAEGSTTPAAPPAPVKATPAAPGLSPAVAKARAWLEAYLLKNVGKVVSTKIDWTQAQLTAKGLKLPLTAEAIRTNKALPKTERWPGTNSSVTDYIKSRYVAVREKQLGLKTA